MADALVAPIRLPPEEHIGWPPAPLDAEASGGIGEMLMPQS